MLGVGVPLVAAAISWFPIPLTLLSLSGARVSNVLSLLFGGDGAGADVVD
jgi:hypothetical protein